MRVSTQSSKETTFLEMPWPGIETFTHFVSQTNPLEQETTVNIKCVTPRGIPEWFFIYVERKYDSIIQTANPDVCPTIQNLSLTIPVSKSLSGERRKLFPKTGDCSRKRAIVPRCSPGLLVIVPFLIVSVPSLIVNERERTK